MKNARLILTLRWDERSVAALVEHLANYDLHIFDSRTNTPATRERLEEVICGPEATR